MEVLFQKGSSIHFEFLSSLLCINTVLFLSAGDKNPETYDLTQLPDGTLQSIEADSYWCMQKLLEGIQDNYTLAQPGIQTKILALKDLMKRLNGELLCLSVGREVALCVDILYTAMYCQHML